MSRQHQAFKRFFVAAAEIVASRRAFPIYVCAPLLAFFACATANAASDAVVRVEEDWKVEVNIPNPDDHAPQIVNSISPTGNLEGLHAVFELNHRSLNNYGAGGMQLQAWS